MRAFLPPGARRTWRPAFWLLLTLLTWGLARPATATHLRGGDVRYRYVDNAGTTPGRPFRYELSFAVYYSCETGPGNSNYPCGRAVLPVAIYDRATGARINDPNNPFPTQIQEPCPNSNGDIFSTPYPADLYLLQPFRDSIVTSQPPAGCNIVAGCAIVVEYRGIVELPVAAQGYIAMTADNARNSGVTNIGSPGFPGSQSSQVLAINIPRPVSAFANSSPIFSDSPVPLICANDTVTITNNAFDAEGDRLVYSFYAPFAYNMGSGGFNDLGPTYTVPDVVNYNPGFTFEQPFGASGFAEIDPVSGQTRYLVPAPGEYVVGVQVSEFRTINGSDVLISTIYREIQLQVANCGVGGTFPPPQISAAQVITIEEGEPASFTVTGTASNNNPLTLSASSPLLDGPGGANATFNGQQGTAANALVTLNGVGTQTATFAYTSTCGSAGTYNVNFKVTDLAGCPIKETPATYLIIVNRPGAPTAINGDNTVCPNTTQSYTATGAPMNTASYQWTVTGGTIVGSATGATVQVRWTTVGTGSVSAVAVSPRGCPSLPLALSVEVFAGVTATLGGVNAAYCLNPAATGAPLTGSPAGGTFSITGAGGTTNLVGNVFTPRVAGTFQITYTVADPNGCPAVSAPFTVVVNPLPVVALAASLPATLCSNDRPVLLAGTVNGAAATTGFTINGNPATVFNPSVLGPGTYTVALVGTGVGNCTATATRTVTVNAAPVVSLTGLQPTYCQNDPAVTLTATADGLPITGTNALFSIGGVPATQLNPAALPVGSVWVRVLGTGPNGCRNRDSVSIEILPLPVLAITGLDAAYCRDAAPVTLAGTVNAVAGGTFTIDGNPATVFNPAALSVGPHLVVFSGTGANACQDTVQRTVRVNPLPVVRIVAPTATSFCLNAPSVALTGNAPGQFFIDGSATAVTSFLPATLGVGTHVIRFTRTDALTGCSNDTTLSITIRPLPVLAITGLQAAYCADAPAVPLTGTIDGVAATAATGTFTIDNVAATQLNPATLAPGVHQVIFTGTGTNGCATTDTLRVTINAVPTVAFTGLNAAYCVDAPAVTLAATVNSSTTVGTVTFTINGDPATVLNPAALAPGTYTVVATGTVTATGCDNTVTQTVTINALPTVAITNLNPAYCVSAPAVPLTATIGGGAGTVAFTINGNPATTFNPAALGAGTYTVVATGTVTATGCDNSATQTVTVNPLPIVTILGLNAAYCQGDAPVTLGGTVSNNGAILFTVNAQPTSVFDPSTLAPGTYTVVATGIDANTCQNTTAQTVVINPRPTVAITGLNAAYCVSAPAVPLAATVTGGASTTTFTINGNTATTFDPAALGAGTYTVVATGVVTATTCQNTATQTVTVNPLPTVAITGLGTSYCQGDGAVTLAGTVNGAAGTVSFTVNGNTATSFDPSTLAPGTYTVTITGTDGNTCQNTATQTVVINPRPAGLTPVGPPSVCPGLTGVPYSLTGALPGQTFEWTVVGGTVATGQGTASITVDFGAANPNASISVTVVDGTTTCRSLPVALPVTVNQVLATQTPTGTAAFCVNGGSQMFSIPLPSPGSTYNWAFTGAGGTSATITSGQGTPSITVTFTQPGPAALVVTETSATPLANCFGTSAPLNITVNPAPDATLTLQASAPAVCAGTAATFTLPGAATSTYQFTVDGAVQPGTAGTFSYPALTPGTYTIGAQETNSFGCVGPVISTTLTVNPVPTAAAIGGPTAICPQGLTQTYTVTGLPGSTFQWTVTGGTITGGQGTGTVTVDFDGTTAAPTLSVTETSSAGCAGPASPLALTLDTSAPTLTLASVSEAQPANRVELTLAGLNAQAGQQLQILRRVSGSGAAFASVGTVSAPATTFADNSADPNAAAYDYRVELTNACGTVLQSAEQTTIRVQATAAEASGDVTLTWNAYQGQPVQQYELLRRTASGSYEVVGTAAAGATTFTATGIGRDAFNQTFRVRAVLAGNVGVSYSNESAVTFQNALATYDVITPNGDNLNDRFVVENAALYANNELAVFNRWGREVYRKKGYDNSWDGDDLPAGTYFYLFTANGQSIKGTVQIIK